MSVSVFSQLQNDASGLARGRRLSIPGSSAIYTNQVLSTPSSAPNPFRSFSDDASLGNITSPTVIGPRWVYFLFVTGFPDKDLCLREVPTQPVPLSAPPRRTFPSFIHVFFIIIDRRLPNICSHPGASPVNAPLVVLGERRSLRLLPVLVLTILLLYLLLQYANRATRDSRPFPQEPHTRTTVPPPYVNHPVPRLAMDAVIRPQSPPCQITGAHFPPDLNLAGEREPRLVPPLTGHQLMELWPAPAPFIPYFPGSSYFRDQERAFFSRSNFYFRVNAGTPQATGSLPQREKHDVQENSLQFPTAPRDLPSSQQPSLSSTDVSSPSQRQLLAGCKRLPPPPPPSRRSRRLRTTPINPLPVTAGASNSRPVGYQAATYHPYLCMQPEMAQDPFTTTDEDSWRYPIPISERRRAGKASRRGYN